MVPQLNLLTSHDVREHWEYIRPRIKEALEYDADGTMVEDVFSALMADQVVLFMAFNDGEPEGFIITRTFFTPCGPECLVWIAHHDGGEGRAADYMPQIAGIARAGGHIRVAIESMRPYARAIPGFKLVRHVYHYDLEGSE